MSSPDRRSERAPLWRWRYKNEFGKRAQQPQPTAEHLVRTGSAVSFFNQDVHHLKDDAGRGALLSVEPLKKDVSRHLQPTRQGFGPADDLLRVDERSAESEFFWIHAQHLSDARNRCLSGRTLPDKL